MTRWTPIEDLAVLSDRPTAEVAHVLGRTEKAVEHRRWFLRRRNVEKFVRKDLCPSCGGMPPLWTPEAIVEAIRQWHAEHGDTPSADEWRASRYDRPTFATVRRVFGTMNNAIEAAGFPRRPPGGAKFWTRERIIEAIQTWAARHGGDPPRKRDWLKSSPEHPACVTVVETFKNDGGWNGAIDAAGFFPRGRYGLRYTGADRKTRIAA